jgi:hypothetical protein
MLHQCKKCGIRYDKDYYLNCLCDAEIDQAFTNAIVCLLKLRDYVSKRDDYYAIHVISQAIEKMQSEVIL